MKNKLYNILLFLLFASCSYQTSGNTKKGKVKFKPSKNILEFNFTNYDSAGGDITLSNYEIKIKVDLENQIFNYNKIDKMKEQHSLDTEWNKLNNDIFEKIVSHLNKWSENEKTDVFKLHSVLPGRCSANSYIIIYNPNNKKMPEGWATDTSNAIHQFQWPDYIKDLISEIRKLEPNNIEALEIQ